MASRSSSQSVSCRRKVIPPIAESEELGDNGQDMGKRIVKEISALGDDGNLEVLRKKKEVMRAYSLVRNKRMGKGALPILREN